MITIPQEVVQRALDRYETAEQLRREMTTVFQTLGDYARPSRETLNNIQVKNKSAERHTQLFDSTLVQANMDHAAGIKSWMSPAGSLWFSLGPPSYLKGDNEVEGWFNTCTEKLHEILASSRFHTEEHEALLDGGAFGIRSLFIERGHRSVPLQFTCWEPGTFSVLENDQGEIDTVFLTKNFTPRQAAQKFGEDNLPDKVKKKLLPSDAAKMDSKDEDTYVLCIYPRDDAERDSLKIDAPNMPIASMWVHLTEKKAVEVSGFMEMPSINSRYLKWGNTPYGLPAAILALADARQLNVLQKDLDLLAEIAANPRLLIPDDMEGTVDLRPGGPTMYRDPNKLPRTWGHEGVNYAIGQDRVKMRRDDIKNVFHLDVFQAFRQITKEMTATEVLAKQREAIDQFSPTFTLMTTEHYGPILQRCFNMVLRQSMEMIGIGRPDLAYFPPPPRKLLRDLGNGQAELPPPVVTYTSRIALALRQIHAGAFQESLQLRMEIGNVIGEAAFDDLNLPMALKEIDRGRGLPEHFFRSPEDVAALQEQRAQAAQAAQLQQQAAAAKDGSAAVKNLQGTPLEGALA